MIDTHSTIERPEGPSGGLAAFRHDVLNGLGLPRKRIPCKYLYDEQGSTLFDQICELDEYYPTRAELAILEHHLDEMAEAIGPESEVVELGSGSGMKTRLLLERLVEPRAYYPVEISVEPLLRSAAELSEQFPDLTIVPVCEDFTSDFDLPTSSGPGRRVVYFPGSTIGNCRPDEALTLLRSIARHAGPGGGLLLGFDIDKDPEIVEPAYNDSLGVSAAFNLNLLVRINRELDGDFDLDAFEHRAEYRRNEERVELSLVSQRNQRVRVAGRVFNFEDGESIHTEDSYKYKIEHFVRLTSRAGFEVDRQWFDPDQLFCVQFLQVA